MYFKVNILLIILSYQCINVLASNYVAGTPGRYNCYIKMPPVDNGYMPIPFQGNVSKPNIIRPDGEGHYIFLHNTLIKLSCSGTHFIAPTKYAVNEINVLCMNGFLLYRNRPVVFNAFRCDSVPVPSMKLTRMLCHHSENNSVLEVGFQAKNFFLKSYRICFDIISKRTVYSWYYIDSPTVTVKQVQISKPFFFETRLFDGINMTLTYDYEVQKKSIGSNFNSSEDADALIGKIYAHSHLTPGHLLSQEEFTYVSEQHATYFYENSVPLWTKFNTRVWKLLQKLFKRNIIRGSTRHLIAAGTYKLAELPDTSGKHHYPLYLSTAYRVPVPEFVWKMDYDVDRQSGTVFIGYNHPYLPNNSSRHFCDVVVCPGQFTRQTLHNLVFCCTKESFEKANGYFDEIIFRPF